MKDGSPQVTPTWIDIDKDGNSVLVNTAEGRIKRKNVSRSKSSHFYIWSDIHMTSLQLGGVIEQISEGADEHADRFAKKYLGMDKYPYCFPKWKRVISKINPEKVFHQQPPS